MPRADASEGLSNEADTAKRLELLLEATLDGRARCDEDELPCDEVRERRRALRRGAGVTSMPVSVGEGEGEFDVDVVGPADGVDDDDGVDASMLASE